jgi:hypothetical protein
MISSKQTGRGRCGRGQSGLSYVGWTTECNYQVCILGKDKPAVVNWLCFFILQVETVVLWGSSLQITMNSIVVRRCATPVL